MEIALKEMTPQAALAFSEAIVNTARDPILVLGADLRVRAANRAFYTTFGTTAGEVHGRLIYTLGRGEWDLPALRELLETALLRQTPFDDFEVEQALPGQARRIMLLNARLLPSEAGSDPMLLLAIEDVTARREAERELQKSRLLLEKANADLARSNAELEQFAYVASHDLQEPLRMVASYTQLLGRRYKGRLDQDADDFIAYAVDGANRMKALINDLLSYSKAGKHAETFQETPLQAAVDRAVDNVRAALTESGGTVTHGDLPVVTADPGQLIQLFQNLIANAVKFRGAAAPRVHVSVVQKATEWIAAVSDNGIGIDPQYFGRIFIIFQRLHNKAEYPGTGMGLAICKRIVERHGGRIWVESPPGGGSTFFFSLPMKGPAA